MHLFYFASRLLFNVNITNLIVIRAWQKYCRLQVQKVLDISKNVLLTSNTCDTLCFVQVVFFSSLPTFALLLSKPIDKQIFINKKKTRPSCLLCKAAPKSNSFAWNLRFRTMKTTLIQTSTPRPCSDGGIRLGWKGWKNKKESRRNFKGKRLSEYIRTIYK